MLPILWVDVKIMFFLFTVGHMVYMKKYEQKRNIEDETIPDPIDLKVGWIGEENGMEQWPRMYCSDISRYYSAFVGKTNLINRLECEYK